MKDAQNLMCDANEIVPQLTGVIEKALNAEFDSSFEYYTESGAAYKAFTCFFDEAWVPQNVELITAAAVAANAATDTSNWKDSVESLSKSSLQICVKWNASAQDPIRTLLVEKIKNPPIKGNFVDEEINWSKRLRSISEENDSIGSIKKANVFADKVTSEEAEIIARRIALQQKQLAEWEKIEHERRFRTFKNFFPFITPEEVDYVFDELHETAEDATIKLGALDFLYHIRKGIALKYTPKEHELQLDNSPYASNNTTPKKRRVNRKSSRKFTSRKTKVYKYHGRLRLDEALAKLDEAPHNPEAAMKGWSDARIRAFKAIKQNPNAYFYRFNAPGEAQRNGPWTPEERQRFLHRLAEVGADGNWGIFSTVIPGRVGYQCSNFYRKLLDEGVVRDPNYFQDSRGKWHYRFSNSNPKNLEAALKSENVENSPSNEAYFAANAASSTEIHSKSIRKAAAPKKKPKRRNNRNDYYETDEEFGGELENDDDCYVEEESRRSQRRRKNSVTDTDDHDADAFDAASHFNEQQAFDNPLPNFIDPISLEPVVRPAISPYGHVMSYESWIRCLNQPGEHKNICPLTKKPLKKRELILLTFDNIDAYRNKIIM